jgi:hypothetical protein
MLSNQVSSGNLPLNFQPARPLCLAKRDAISPADTLTQAFAVNGAVTHSSQLLALSYKASKGIKAVGVAAGLASERRQIVAASEGRKARTALSVKNGIAPVIRIGGGLMKTTGKFLEFLAAPFAALDVYHAIKEQDPKAKNAAWANAGLSVAGAAAGIAGVMAEGAGPSMPLLVISVLTGGFQVLDTFVLKGKGADWLGEHLVKPLKQEWETV